MSIDHRRREIVRNTALLGIMTGTGAVTLLGQATGKQKNEAQEPEVTATEDLMREHGVLRRILLVYAEIVPSIRQNTARVDAAALHQAAQLFRTFGEQYHEKMLEEQHIFPIIRKMNNELARYADVLTAQHARGREVTDYITSVTNDGRISAAHAEPLARAFEGFVRMYENHAAREDTMVFPAWKTNYSNKQLDEMSDQFEEIEKHMFGKDGFEDAVKKVAGIEGALGFSDLAQFTPPSPPKP